MQRLLIGVSVAAVLLVGTQRSSASADKPNVVFILADDLGFNDTTLYGGTTFYQTPNIQRLAARGMTFGRAYTASPLCSPTRASLLTGRNHTRVGSGTIAERAIAFDGFTGVMRRTAATVADVLHHYGYKTSAFGKWHNTPMEEASPAGPGDLG